MKARNEWWVVKLADTAKSVDGSGHRSELADAIDAAFAYIVELEEATSIDDFRDDFPAMLRVDEVRDILAEADPLAALREWLAENDPDPLIVETIEVKGDVL